MKAERTPCTLLRFQEKIHPERCGQTLHLINRGTLCSLLGLLGCLEIHPPVAFKLLFTLFLLLVCVVQVSTGLKVLMLKPCFCPKYPLWPPEEEHQRASQHFPPTFSHFLCSVESNELHTPSP